MKRRVADEREFIRGAARFRDLLYVITRSPKLVEQDIAHTSLVAVDGSRWADGLDTAWNASAVAVARAPTEKAVLIGEDGDVETYVGGVIARESIRGAKLIRNAKTIDGHVYACGMGRQVFRRAGDAKWVAMHAAAPAKKTKDAVGFEAIDGFSANHLYAAGWGGEVWHFDGSTWKQATTGVDTTLTAVCCAGNGVVYAAGQNGVLLQGRGTEWSKVPLKASADLWDLCWFADRLYVATMSGLFTLKGKTLKAVDFGELGDVSCFSLSTAEDVLWSVGKSDVVSFDGTTWNRYAVA